MSQDQIDALVARLASDAAFASAFDAATTPEDAHRIAADCGFDVSPSELASAASNRTLSDADLAAVSGGTPGGGGVDGLSSGLASWLD